jgi:hypothetical protein
MPPKKIKNGGIEMKTEDRRPKTEVPKLNESNSHLGEGLGVCKKHEKKKNFIKNRSTLIREVQVVSFLL